MIRGVPYDDELEYLEFTGTQWVDTEYYLSLGVEEVEVTFSITDTTWRGIVICDIYAPSAGNANSVDIYNYAPSGVPQRIAISYRDEVDLHAVNIAPPTNNQYVVSVTNGRITVNGKATTFNQHTSGKCVASLLMGKGRSTYDSTALWLPLKGRIYGLRILDKTTSTPIHDYIPVRVGQTALMYDRVTRTFPKHYGTFVGGPVASTPLMGVHLYQPANLWKWPTQVTTGSATPTSVWTPILDIVYPRVSSNGYVNNAYPYDPFVAGPNTIVSACNSGYGAAVFRALPPGKYKISADISLYSGSATNASILAIDYAPSAGQWVYSRYVGSGSKPFGVISTSFTVESGHLTAISFFCGVQSTSILVKNVSLIEVP